MIAGRQRGDKMNVPYIIGLICTVLFLMILPLQGHALTPSQVFDKVKECVVVVKTLNAQGKVKGQGSGVLLPSGKIATNCHVVERGASYQVGRGKQLVRATLYAEDGDKDICLLDAKGLAGKPAQVGKAADLKVGDPVYTVGAPRGLELSLSDGIVAQLRGGTPPVIQITAAISPGSSGGGLFDGEGRLVGLTTLYIEGGQSLNFAMPVEWIVDIKPRLSSVRGPAMGNLTVKSNVAEARVYIDGKYQGDAPVSVTLKPGTYSITLKKAGYPDAVEDISFEASDTKTIIVVVMERPTDSPSPDKSASVSGALGIPKDGRFIAHNNGTVMDKRTNLMWAAKDNGSDINWANAKSYCEHYRGGGYTDWRLPTPDELAGLYDAKKSHPVACDRNQNIHVATELIDITCFSPWTSETRGPDSYGLAKATTLFFHNREWGTYTQSLDRNFRALPVRSGK